MEFTPEEFNEFLGNIDVMALTMLYSLCMRGSIVPKDVQLTSEMAVAEPIIVGTGRNEMDVHVRVDVYPQGATKGFHLEDAANMNGVDGRFICPDSGGFGR